MEHNNYQGAFQIPLVSGFNALSDAGDVIKGIDLTGKVAMVTGGNTGIGFGRLCAGSKLSWRI